MSTPLVDQATLTSTIEALKSIPVTFPDNYQAPPESLPSRISVFGLEVLPPPAKKPAASSASLGDILNVTFKSLKPPYTTTLPISPTSPILTLKSTLASHSPSNPLSGIHPSQIKLLLKGKALVDTKLVKDYDITPESTITVMASKPVNPPVTITSSTSDPINTNSTASKAEVETSSPLDLAAADRDPVPPQSPPSLGASPNPGHKRRVSDIPAVTLSPAGTPGPTTPLLGVNKLPGDGPATHVPFDAVESARIALSNTEATSGGSRSRSASRAGGSIDLTLVPDPIVKSTSLGEDNSPYHQTLANPKFWLELREFLETKFGKDAGGRPGDADVAFEEFLRSAKVNLSAHEIAKIRDQVGITGLGGY